MKVVVALRATNASQARQLLAEQACEIHKSRFESQEPALRNLIDGLYQRGLDVELRGASLAWFLIEAALTPKQWLEQDAVAICFSYDWFQQQAAQIRYLKGIAYCDAAASWAKLLPINDNAASIAQPDGKIDWQGLAVESNAVTLESNQSQPFTREDEPLLADTSRDATVLTKQPVMNAQASPKKNSARKIVGKILTATKNITKRKPNADSVPDVQDKGLLSTAPKVEKLSNPIGDDLARPVIKKRGRPRKNPEPSLEVNPSLAIVESGVAPVVETEAMAGAEVAVAAEPVALPKKRGRPRKVVAAVEPEIDEEQLDLFV